jgi:hypothetical protein
VRHPQLGVKDARKRQLINDSSNIRWLERYFSQAGRYYEHKKLDESGDPGGGSLQELPGSVYTGSVSRKMVEARINGRRITSSRELKKLLKEFPELKERAEIQELLRQLQGS